MKYQTLPIGPVPSKEVTPSLEDPHRRRQLMECLVFSRMLSRLFPAPAAYRAEFIVQMTPVGDDAFYAVSLLFDVDNPAAEQFARSVDANAPMYWDELARRELDWYGTSSGYYHALVRGEIADGEIPQFYRGTEPPTIANGRLPEMLFPRAAPVSSVAPVRELVHAFG